MQGPPTAGCRMIQCSNGDPYCDDSPIEASCIEGLVLKCINNCKLFFDVLFNRQCNIRALS